MDLYFSGGETSDHRDRLVKAGVKNIAVSFWGLKKRIADPVKTFDLKDRFPDDVNILLDSGAFSASKKADFTDDDWVNYIDSYMDFVDLNIDRITMVTEFDALAIPHSDLEQMREDFWNQLPADKFMPVWHEAHGGFRELEKLSEEYDNLAITNDAINKRNITARLNNLVGTYGVNLHGMAITKPDELREIRFNSVSSTSWVSPMRYGDTIVWDGGKLVRYPVKYKDQARKRHRMLFERNGFDAEAIANDDPNEVTALSIWSWLRFEERLNSRTSKRGLSVVSSDEESPTEEDLLASWSDDPDLIPAESSPGAVDSSSPEMRNLPAVRDVASEMLPVFGVQPVPTYDDQGNTVGHTNLLTATQESLRNCDTCHVAASCPKMEPGSTCAFKFPVAIQTRQQLNSAMSALMELQMQRVGFMRFAEEMEGGYADPNVSTELDRFFKMAKLMKEVNDNTESLRIEVTSKAQSGVLSRLFGEKNVPQAQDVIDADKAEAFLGDVLDAEIVE